MAVFALHANFGNPKLDFGPRHGPMTNSEAEPEPPVRVDPMDVLDPNAEVDISNPRTQVELLRAARKFMAEAKAGDPEKFKAVTTRWKVLSSDQIKLRKRREIPLGHQGPADAEESREEIASPLDRQVHQDWLRSSFEEL